MPFYLSVWTMKLRANGRTWRKQKFCFTKIMHSLLITMAKFKLLLHSPYSPGLVPCDFYPSLNLKQELVVKRFTNNAEVITAKNGYFEDLEKSFYQTGIMSLEHRQAKCICKSSIETTSKKRWTFPKTIIFLPRPGIFQTILMYLDAYVPASPPIILLVSNVEFNSVTNIFENSEWVFSLQMGLFNRKKCNQKKKQYHF